MDCSIALTLSISSNKGLKALYISWSKIDNLLLSSSSFRKAFSQSLCILVPRVAATLLILFASSSPTLSRHLAIQGAAFFCKIVVTEGYKLPVGVSYLRPLSVFICFSFGISTKL